MGTDFVRLFDKRLMDEILGWEQPTCEQLVSSHRQRLRELGAVSWIQMERTSLEASVKELLESNVKLVELKRDLTNELCILSDFLYLDYCACYVEVFGDDPPGSITSRSIFGEESAGDYLLLLPEHLDKMLLGIEMDEWGLRVMTPESISTLRDWRDRCSADPGLMVAYCFD